MRNLKALCFEDASNLDIKRENANVNGDSAMGTMLRIGSEASKDLYLHQVINPKFAKAHEEGDIHIHDLDFYSLTTTCTQIELRSLFKGGFCTGHGVLREPQDIYSYAALACIAVQANQNDQHGGQSIVDFDYAMGDGVRKTFKRRFYENLRKASALDFDGVDIEKLIAVAPSDPSLVENVELRKYFVDNGITPRVMTFVQEESEKDTRRATYQAMESFVHNLNTMNSRAGAQVPFSSVNYGLDISSEGRLAIEQLLLATEAGLGHGETPIFPIQICRVKEDVNYNPGDPNYDLFKLGLRVSAKRLFPNFSFIDAPYNLQYYKPGHPETEVAYMGCRTRVMGNNYDKSAEVAPRRGNLSFTSINLPRLAIKAKGNLQTFYSSLDEMLELVSEQLLERLCIVGKRKVKNMPFLMGEHVWMDSEKLGWDDTVEEVLKHGTLSIGFIGLAETLVALVGKHHGEDERSQSLGLDIVERIRAFCDRKSEETGLNFTCLATPAEGLSGRFVRIDRERYGSIPGVTDREYYTNSFHVPVYFPITAAKKLEIEGPYHALTNAGHISYVEMDGDPTRNLEAFEKIVRYMHDSGIGYGAVNHPVDRDPICGYTGIINDTCPRCGRHESAGQPFERLRRITGYLVGSLSRWNNAKRAEERDRIKHA